MRLPLIVCRVFILNCNMYLSSNYIYDIYTIPIDYSAMVFEPRDAVFYDFEDEDLDDLTIILNISPSSKHLHNNTESVKIYEPPTIDLSQIKNVIWDFLSLVRAFTDLVFAVIFKVSGGLGVLAAIAAVIATLLQQLALLNCFSQEGDTSVQSYFGHDRGSNCISQIQDKIAESLVGE